MTEAASPEVNATDSAAAVMEQPKRRGTKTKAGNNRLLFARKFLQQGIKISSFYPSSKFLSRAMCRHVDGTKKQTLVELGGGTGPVTEMIVKLMHPESTLVVSELDPDFAAVLRKRFGSHPQVRIVEGNAGDIADHLTDLPPVDVTLCGLPTPSLPEPVKASILNWVRETPDMIFTQLTVAPWVFLPVYKKMFKEVEFDLVVRSVPPGGVYHCKHPK